MEFEIKKFQIRIPKIFITRDTRLIFAEILNNAKINLYEKIMKKIISIDTGLIYYDIENIDKRRILLEKFFYQMDLNIRLRIYHSDICDD